MTNTSVNVESMIGTLMMMGIVVLEQHLCSWISRIAWSAGATAEHAVLEAGRDDPADSDDGARDDPRLLPLALGFGEGNETMVPLARAVVGGWR